MASTTIGPPFFATEIRLETSSSKSKVFSRGDQRTNFARRAWERNEELHSGRKEFSISSLPTETKLICTTSERGANFVGKLFHARVRGAYRTPAHLSGHLAAYNLTFAQLRFTYKSLQTPIRLIAHNLPIISNND